MSVSSGLLVIVSEARQSPTGESQDYRIQLARKGCSYLLEILHCITLSLHFGRMTNKQRTILVLIEDALEETCACCGCTRQGVSILFVMEDAREVPSNLRLYRIAAVSILVLMEDAWEDKNKLLLYYTKQSFNPCCRGRCSGSQRHFITWILRTRFNPCCSGRCSGRAGIITAGRPITRFNPCCGGRCSGRCGDRLYRKAD